MKRGTSKDTIEGCLFECTNVASAVGIPPPYARSCSVLLWMCQSHDCGLCFFDSFSSDVECIRPAVKT